MARDPYQLAQGAAAAYERQKVVAIFRPLAEATLAAVEISPDDAVLDVACGTGIVSRVLHERLAPKAAITGIDLNEGMIEMARAVTEDRRDAFRWRVGDVTRMPFEAGAFSVALCQQGLQFFPDEGAAVQEMRRVLRPGGRIVITIWSGAPRFFTALAEAIARHVSPEEAARSLAPFAYSGLDAVPDLLRASSFAEVQTRDLTIDRVIREPETSIPLEIRSNPVGPAVSARGEDVMAHIVADVLSSCADLMRGGDLVSPQTSRLFTAVAA